MRSEIPPTESEMIQVSYESGIVNIALDRPEKLNALTAVMRSDIMQIFDWSSSHADVRVVNIVSSDSRAFCVGVDLAESANVEVLDDPALASQRSMYEAILECSKPTIATLSGWTLGAGCEIALACDMRIASSSLKIGLPEAQRGMGGHFGSHVLIRAVPKAVAFRMLYTGDSILAEEALAVGLVSDVVSEDEIIDFSSALAMRIASNAPLTLARYKAALGALSSLPLRSALHIPTGPNPYASADRREGSRAFLERRPAVWRGE